MFCKAYLLISEVIQPRFGSEKEQKVFHKDLTLYSTSVVLLSEAMSACKHDNFF